ncbi:MAG: hypothetical protein GY754_46095 [bacterium]|nr:hypothetical protein [bacterium]
MISIDKDKCTECGICYTICPDYVIAKLDGGGCFIRYPDQCCACGHCIDLCPSGAITHEELSPDDFEHLPDPGISPGAMKSLLLSRRSIRHYRDAPVEEETLARLLEAAHHCGSGGNLQAVEFLAISNKDFMLNLEKNIIDILWKTGLNIITSGGIAGKLIEMKLGPELVKKYKSYHYIIKHRKKHDELPGMIFRNAPMILVAHEYKKNPLCHQNCSVAMRNIELMALSMGLGSCWIGFLVSSAINKPKKINKLLGLDASRQVGGAIILGYPGYKYKKKMPRREAGLSSIDARSS